MTKIPKFPGFQKFYAIFGTFSTNFVDWNDEKRQQEKSLLWNMLSGKTIAVFANLEPTPKKTNFKNYLFSLYSIFVESSVDFVDQVVKMSNKGRCRC